MKTTAHTPLTTNVYDSSATLEIEIEELEQIVAPVTTVPDPRIEKLATNHNETFVRYEEILLDV